MVYNKMLNIKHVENRTKSCYNENIITAFERVKGRHEERINPCD